MNDLISRSALKEKIESYPVSERTATLIVSLVQSASAIDAVPAVRGEWSQRSCFDEDENVYVCSVCDEPWTLTAGTPLENNMHHCPNCGAKMEDKP